MVVPTYEKALQQDTRDLVAAVRRGEVVAPYYRGDDVGAVVAHLEAKRSVVVVGAAGGGKTALVHGVAASFAATGQGRLRQLSTAAVMAGTRYIGDWQSKLDSIVQKAMKKGVVLYFTDVWNLVSAGATDVSPTGFLEALRPLLASGKLVLLGEATPQVLEKMQGHQGFVDLFEVYRLAALADDQVDDVVAQAAAADQLHLDGPGRRRLVALTSRFLPSRPQPGPALRLLKQVKDYQRQKEEIGEPEALTASFVEKVFSIYSGLPRFVVSRDETMAARDMRAWFHDRIVGQDEAIQAVVESITLFKAGLHDPDRPIGSFLFVGPTGVGKTEMARALARFLFGSSTRLLRFDLSEFKDYHSFEMLVGRPGEQRPARLVDPVRQQPFQVVLFDELEKAHSNVWDLFLQLLDEGRLTPPGGESVDFRNTLVIATSNVGADQGGTAVGFRAPPAETERRQRMMESLERAFRPEFLNRFQHVVVFQPLTQEQVRTLARKELTRVLQREGITERNVVVEVDDQALDVVIARGYDSRYGARALKREIQRSLILPIAVVLMERNIAEGTILRVVARDGRIAVRVVETAVSRQSWRELEPVRGADGQKLTRGDLTEAFGQTRLVVDSIAKDVDEQALLSQRERLDELRSQSDFWSHPDQAVLTIRQMDQLSSTLDRLESLRGEGEEIGAILDQAPTRRDLEIVARRLDRLQERTAIARRELVFMGAEGQWDSLVEVAPLGERGNVARDFLLDTYLGWAKYRHLQTDWLREPLTDNEPALIALRGHCAQGYLVGERGLHRLREDKQTALARVTVAPWNDVTGAPRFVAHRALKLIGQQGGKIRSRVECEAGLVLQNARTLAENRELAAEIAPSWLQGARSFEEVVRRVSIAPAFKLRDTLTGIATGRTDVLAPGGFHRLLCQRIDAAQAELE
jgi:ATP-dependent Clp protease ATP-binding subunit ClpC